MADKPLVHFTRGRQRFEVFKEARLGGGFAYAGYMDGERAVTAERPEVAARALLSANILGIAGASSTLKAS